ncbi:MAG: glutathione S-transferase domain-containing protein, partial [Pseudoxanthomonas sp.]
VIWGMFFQKGVKRYLFGEEPDEAVIARARDEQLPVALDYLESQLPAEGFLFGELGVADISIASFFRNAAFVRYTVDAHRWPRMAALLERAWGLPVFRKLAELEDKSLRTSLPEQRSVLAGLGAPVTETTLGTSPAQRGPMRPD